MYTNMHTQKTLVGMNKYVCMYVCIYVHVNYGYMIQYYHICNPVLYRKENYAMIIRTVFFAGQLSVICNCPSILDIPGDCT